MTVDVRDGMLFINGRRIAVPAIVKEYAICNQLVIVVMEPEHAIDNNVLALDESGREIWRVPISSFNVNPNMNYYNGVGVYEGELRVFHIQGIYYVVDPIKGTFVRESSGRAW